MQSLRVVNQTSGAVLAERASLANTFVARARGLLGREGLAPGEGLVIEPCGSVHTVGMAFPIDVLHLDRQNGVLRVVTNLRPWRLGPLVWRSHRVVELPAGTLEATETKVGHTIDFHVIPSGARNLRTDNSVDSSLRSE